MRKATTVQCHCDLVTRKFQGEETVKKCQSVASNPVQGNIKQLLLNLTFGSSRKGFNKKT